MTPAESEAARRALVKAFVSRLQNHDPDTKPLGADAEPFATELVATAMQLGWRALLERSDWRQQATATGAPDPEWKAAALAGDWETARRLQGITPAVPTPRSAPEDNDNNSNEED